MSLHERVAQTRERIHALQALKERAKSASEFEQRANTLGHIASDLATLCVPAAVLKQAGIDVPQLDQALLGALLARANQMMSAYAQERSSILKPFPDESLPVVFINPCTTFKQRTEAALRQAWQGWVNGQLPAIDQDVLSVLHGVAALRETVAGIQALLAAVSLQANILPRDAHGVEEVRTLCARATLAWQELAGDGIDREVLEFLRAAGGHAGASYDLLTPSILTWLDTHNLRRVLRIRLS